MNAPLRRILSCSAGVCIIIAAVMPAPAAGSGSRTTDSTQTVRDSLTARDSTASADTSGRMSTPSLVGTLDRNLGPASLRTREDLHWLDYRYLGGILDGFPGMFIRDQQGEGQYNQPSMFGADGRAIAIMANGRLLNDPQSGIYNLYHFTTEYADRVEVVSGPRAFLYAMNSTGAAVNLITKNYNSNKPFTKLNYSEGAYGYGYADGTFSQNISRKTNLTFGFQHQLTDGRYINSIHDAWNSRAKIRFNVSRDFNIILAHYYTAAETQLNGGIDLARTGTARAFDRLLATVQNPDAYEKLSRHDLDISFVGTFLADTVNVSHLTLYYSGSYREYRDEENRATPNGVAIHSDHTSSWMGALLTQNFDTEGQRFSLGGNLELRQIEGSPNLGRLRNVVGAAWAKEELILGRGITLAGFARYDAIRGRSYIGAGTDATVRVTPSVSVFGGFSTSRRTPNYQESSWVDSTVSRTGEIAAELHRVVEAGMQFGFGSHGSLRLAYQHRTIEDPILFSPLGGVQSPFPSLRIANGSAVSTNGVSGSVAIRFWVVAVEGSATWMLRTAGGATLDDYPKLWGNGGVYFWSTLLNDKLELKAGLKGRFAFSHTGMAFNPEVVAYVPYGGPALGTSSSVDLFLIARIGDAHIHFMWENLTNVKYFTTPVYAGGERALRFGISWEFLN